MATTTVTATYLDPAGHPCRGRVTFRLVATSYHTGLSAIFPTLPVVGVLDDQGQISVELEPTADFDTDGMTYQVTERITGAQRDAYYIEVPTAGEIDLGAIASYDDPLRVVHISPDIDLSVVGYATTVEVEEGFETLTDTHLAGAVNGVGEGNTAAANTSALNDLLEAAQTAGKSVVLPPGRIEIDDVTVLAPLRGAGRGLTTLVAADTVTIDADDVTISDLSVETSNGSAFTASNLDRLELRNVGIDFDASVVTGWLTLDAYNIDRLRVVGCRSRIGGYQLSLCDDFVLDGNYVDGEYSNTNEPIHISGQSSGQVVNNTVVNTLTDALDLYSSGHYCVVANNRFLGLRGAAGMEIKVAMSDTPGNSSGPGNVIDGVVVANNIFRDFNPPASSSTRTGIYAEYTDLRAVPAYDITETNRALIITGNVLEDFNVDDTGGGVTVTYHGIVYTGHNGLITNNIIRHMRAWQSATPVGIKLANPTDAACTGVRVAGNVIAGVENNFGIQVGNLNRCQIDDNIIRTDDVNSVVTKHGVDIVSGSDLNHCSISGNTFACNHATGFGLRSTGTTSTINRCRINNNTLYQCGVSLASATFTTFHNNVMDNATNSQVFAMGVSGTPSVGCSYVGNHITMSSDYGLALTDHDGFVIQGNTFNATNRGVLLVGETLNGVIGGNLSVTQSGGSQFPHYSGVSAPNQATNLVGDNLVV